MKSDNLVRGVVVVFLAFFAIIFILNNRSEKSDKKGEKISVSAGINISAEVFKAVVDEKDAKVYNGNVIIHCRCSSDAYGNIMMINIITPMIQANQLSVGDTIRYVRSYVSSEPIDINFWVDEKSVK